MKELIESFNKESYLKLGDGQFSPVMDASIGISLDYCKSVKNDENTNSPLFLCFPEKRAASLWLSIAILRNYFFSDYIDNEIEPIDFKRGDKVLIYGCVAEVSVAAKESVKLIFKHGAEANINKKHWSNLSIVNKSRMPNLHRTYVENKRDYTKSRNSISKILEPKESVVINQNNLNSKILLISGRGNVHVFRKLLEEKKVYNEPLSKTFPVDKNIIIAQDLKAYKALLSSDYEIRVERFKKLLFKLIRIMQQLEVKEIVKNLFDTLDNECHISSEFDIKFRDFINEYLDTIPNLKYLDQEFPGVRDTIPSKLRAVIINDIQQLEEYKNTIDSFLKLNIPVIFISNRNITNVSELNFYNQLFIKNPEYLRINWNRAKINALLECETNTSYIDEELWFHCKRYAQQKIHIDVSAEHPLDELLSRLVGWVKELNNFEVLQKAFYNYFYPAIYALKNSNKSNKIVKDLILQFKEKFEDIKHLIQRREIVDDFSNAINLCENFEVNTKSYSLKENIFSIETLVHGENARLNIPLDTFKANVPSSTTNNILFTGYPYNEYFEKYLLKTICVDFTPKVNIKCWPKEASLTLSYLERRIRAGYFTDNLHNKNHFKEKYLLKSEKDFGNEINLFLSVNIPKIDNVVDEAPFEYLHTFKYKGYNVPTEGKHSFTTTCNILNFTDGSFMFLPTGSSVLAQSEDRNGKQGIRKQGIHDLNIGDKVFISIKDIGTYRKISKTNKVIEMHFQELELWRECLQALFAECGEDLGVLELKLKEVKKVYGFAKGNPIKSSIQRWLFDEEMIAPETDNLRIILKASNVDNLEVKLEELTLAYKAVSSYTIGLGSKIKNNIDKQPLLKPFESNIFSIRIDDAEIEIDGRYVISIDKTEMEVDYRNTRKFLC